MESLFDPRRRGGSIEPMVRQRVRIRFSKSGSLKYIGHKDLLRTFEALFRRARLPLAMSGGFHPKVRMSFPSALALGIEGCDEVLELEMNESAPTVDAGILLADLNRCSVDGLTFLSATPLGPAEKKAQLVSTVYHVVIPEPWRASVPERVRRLLAEPSVMVSKPNGKAVDLRANLLAMDFREETGTLTVELATLAGPEAGIREVLVALDLGDSLFRDIFPKRIQCRLAGDLSDQN